MTKKQKVIISLVLVVIFYFAFKIMVITSREETTVLPLGGVVREIIAPIQKGITWITASLNDVVVYFNDNRFLRQQNKEMAEKIVRLEEEVYSLKEQELENQRLLLLLEYKEEKTENYDLAMAKVIGRNHANWYETLLVNQGSKQGIWPGMVVVNHDGLIGRIINVTPNTAEVLLILDREGAVGARIFENRHTPGVVVGTSKSQYLQMIHLPHDLPIEPNQTVVTSGLSGVYPPGIRIGKVIEVLPEPGGLMKRATLKPFVDFFRLEEVLIIKKVKTPEEKIVSEEESVVENA
ncbi:MAG TPA: rod shape-determining protein MreC [Clostridia bacterium]|nr:rod shape-determining protein MreC [Clostridia bacterium]HHY06569.1 rod shape-determining protein MreC [Clostridia bacterium]